MLQQLCSRRGCIERRRLRSRPSRVFAIAAAASGFLAALLGPSVAQPRPQPTISCSVSDHSFLLELVVPLRPDGSADPRGMQGSLDIHHQKLPLERRRWSLDKRQPTQLWLLGNELRVRLMLGIGEQLMDVVIETARRSQLDSEFAGNISLRSAEGVRLTGRITCGTDWP